MRFDMTLTIAYQRGGSPLIVVGTMIIIRKSQIRPLVPSSRILRHHVCFLGRSVRKASLSRSPQSIHREIQAAPVLPASVLQLSACRTKPRPETVTFLPDAVAAFRL